MWQGFYTQGKENRALTWTEHWAWWKSRKNWRIFIIQLDKKSIGVLSFSQLDSWFPQVGIYIGEVNLWNKGYGKQALTLGLDWLKSNGYNHIWTSILKDNIRSIKLFESLGFKRIGEARPGESLYRKQI